MMEKLKREKASAKAAYTRSRTKLLLLVQSELKKRRERTEVNEQLDCFDEAFEKVIVSFDSRSQLCETA